MSCAIKIVSVATALLCFSIAHAQSSRPAFEVAVIKPSTDDSGPAGINRSTRQFMTTSLSLPFLIRWAYDLDEDRLIAPKGLDSAKFDITAKTPEGEKLIPNVGLRQMMQSLLSDRFKLSIHRETRELSSYALVTDKDGPKVRFVDATQPVGMNPFKMTDRGRIVGTRVTAEMLAKVLSDQIKRPVQDLSGVSNSFDFVLEWMPDTLTDQDAGDTAARPSLFTALSEQLGFRLQARKTAVEVIVVDHIEKLPTEN
jgi:uncharacterized protein (TIGR03435 family)